MALAVRCCRLQRLVIVKRWVSGTHFRTIERCRRCGTWLRREVEIAETNGKLVDTMKTSSLTDITSTQTPNDEA